MQGAVHGPLRVHASAGGAIVQRHQQGLQLPVFGAAFDGDRPLGRRRQPVGCRQTQADALFESKAIQTRAGEHDRVVVAGIQLGQSCVDVAAQVQQLQIGTTRAQLRLPPQRGSAHPCAVRQGVQRSVKIADEGIGGIGARQDRRQRERRVQLHRHVLERMHRAIGFAPQHGQLQFFQEQSLAADGSQRTVQHFVAAGAHRYQADFDSRVRGAEQRGHMFGLPEGKRALAGGDADRLHSPIMKPFAWLGRHPDATSALRGSSPYRAAPPRSGG